jgi:Putative Ig domain/Lipase (class 3)
MTQLNTTTGDGSILLDVNGFGSFGKTPSAGFSFFGSSPDGVTDAIYDPVGDLIASQTTYRSQIAIKINDETSRSFFDDLDNQAEITNAITLNSGTAQSNTTSVNSFTAKGLNFKLTQKVSDIFQAQGQPRSGSNLSQTYEITNPGNVSVSLELVRYFDGDLEFDDTLFDAGGRFIRNGQEVLFETDSGETAQTSTTFIGITTTERPSASSVGRYEVGKYDTVRDDVLNGYILNGLVSGDSNGNGFIDQGPYDVASAFSNKYTINPGQTVTYVTNTTFGQGAPATAVFPNRPPIVGNHISDVTATSGTTFKLVVAVDAFKDFDAGDTLTYKVSLDNGDALPDWLKFDVATRTFSGTPAASDASSIRVKLTAIDSQQGSVSDLFSINVVQPTVVGVIPAGNKDYTYEFLSKEVAYRTGWKKNDKLSEIYLGTKFQQVAGDYVVDTVFEDSQSGFYALGLTSITQAPVLVIRGTEPTANSYADILSDINQNGIGSNQYTRNSIAPLAWLKNTKTTTTAGRIIPPDITGHSLGGALAQAFAANATNASTTLGDIVTFNSPGVSATTVDKFKADKASRVEHYIVSGDFVSLGGEKFLPGKYDLFDFTDPNPLNNHLKPILISQVNYGATDADKQTKAVDVKAVDVSGSTSDNTTSGSTNWLNSSFFTYADSEYFSLLAAAELATQVPGLQAFSTVPPALLFRGTTEKFRQVIADGVAKVFNGIQNPPAPSISLALPKSDLNIFGLKLTAESLFANLSGTQSLKLQGKVSLSDIYSSAIADFAGDNYIKVDNSGVEVVGSLEIRGFTIVPSLWEVRDAELKFNTAAKTINGSADILIPAGIRVGGTLGLVNGKLDSIGINSNGLSIPIATTGALLRSIGGSIKNISTNSNTTPINFNGAVKITDSISSNKTKVILPSQFSSIIGAEGIPNIWALDVNGTIDKNHLTGIGNLSILGGIAKGTATATLDWSQKVLSADANLSILNGFISTQAHFTANSNADITLGGAAQVKIPDFFPVGAGSTINGNFLLQYINDNDSSNDFVASFTKIDFPRVGVFQLPSIERGTKISFDGKIDWNVGKELFAQSITTQRSALSLELSLDAQVPFAATTLDASSGFQAPLAATAIATNQYSVQANTQWLVLNAAWTNNSSIPVTVRLISSTGKIINEIDFAANNISIVNDLTDTKNRSVIIGNPTAGLWSMEVVNATELTGLQYRAFRDSVAPTIQIDPLVDNGGQNLTINYKAIDPDSAAKISLFYSSNSMDFGGTLIKNDIAENDIAENDGNGSYVWNTEGLATGDYYVYAMISDGLKG